MAGITSEELRRVAAEARLALPEDRLPALLGELNAMLARAEPLSHPGLLGVQEAIGIGARGLPARGDHGPSVPLDRSLDVIAPDVRDGFVVIPGLSTDDVLRAR